MLFCTFRVNKRPTNVGADDWFVKCYENGMDHRLNRLLNPTFNNKNMEVRYCFLASFRLKLAKNGIFVANMYIFCDFSRFATTFAEVEKLKKPHGDRPANQILWGVEVCRHNLTKTYCLFAKFETFANPHLFVHRDVRNCGMGPGPCRRTRERKTSNGHMEGATTTPPTTKAKQLTQNEA